MAGTPANNTQTLIEEFEESFQVSIDATKKIHQIYLFYLISMLQQCVHAITKQEASTGSEKDEIAMDVDLTTTKFIDLARQMEAFFIQKRFLLSVLKPQMMLKEENGDLRFEITRKDDIIKKHYDRIELYKNMLSDSPIQQQTQPPPPFIAPQQQQQPTQPLTQIPMSLNPALMQNPQMPMPMQGSVPRMPMQVN